MKYLLIILCIVLIPLYAFCGEGNIQKELQKLREIEKKEYNIKSDSVGLSGSKKKTDIAEELSDLEENEIQIDSSFVDKQIEEKAKQIDYKAPATYKEYSIRIGASSYPEKSSTAANYKKSNAVEIAFNYKIKENLDVGISGSFLSTKMAESVQGANTVKPVINTKILSAQATYFPFYRKDSFNLYIGSKLNFFINELELNIPFNSISNKKSLGWEAFGGVLVPVTDKIAMDLTLGYQNRSFYHTYTNNITSTDYEIDFDENIVYVSLGMRI